MRICAGTRARTYTHTRARITHTTHPRCRRRLFRPSAAVAAAADHPAQGTRGGPTTHRRAQGSLPPRVAVVPQPWLTAWRPCSGGPGEAVMNSRRIQLARTARRAFLNSSSASKQTTELTELFQPTVIHCDWLTAPSTPSHRSNPRTHNSHVSQRPRTARIERWAPCLPVKICENICENHWSAGETH